MQLCVVVGELLQLKHHGLLGLLGLHQLLLGLGPLLRLLHDVLALGLDGSVGLLHEILIGLLRILLGTDGLCFHGLGIADDLLDHAHHAATCGVLIVGLEASRRRRPHRLLLLHQGCRLALLVEVSKHTQGCLQQLLRLTLVRHRCLELFVLLLAVLTRALQLHLHLRNLSLQGIDRLCQGLDGHLQVLDLCDQVLLLTLLLLSLELVGVELVHAKVLVLDLVRLLLQKLCNHVVNSLLHARKSIQLHLVGQC
mmetsp:Transcript_65017/g.168986  ORF Transcript_65017/g.168986 Transcript_65017/m.168986 type:complete len:253 (+) Transcript_65017:182-940(+)